MHLLQVLFYPNPDIIRAGVSTSNAFFPQNPPDRANCRLPKPNGQKVRVMSMQVGILFSKTPSAGHCDHFGLKATCFDLAVSAVIYTSYRDESPPVRATLDMSLQLCESLASARNKYEKRKNPKNVNPRPSPK
jgi:hypothetical protein